MRKFWNFILGFLAVVGLLTLALAGAGLYGLSSLEIAKPAELPKEILLELDFERGLIDEPPPGHDPLRALAKPHGPLHLHEVTATLEAAAKDNRVKALNVRLGSSGIGLGMAQEVRDAIKRFKASGKPVSAFAESFGEMGGGTIDIYLAAVADDIWLQPSGDFGLTGFSAETPFVKGTLDLLGIKPEFERRHEYKSAPETFTQKSMSPEAKASMRALLDSFIAQVATGIAEGRKLPGDRLRKLIDQGPFSADEALELKLIDHIGYLDEADDALTEKFPQADFVDLVDYAAAQPAKKAHGAKIVVIHAQGPVVGGTAQQGLDGDKVIASEDISQALSDASDDDAVSAIILRIDSPGGSYLASDTIWRAVALARQAGKPVIASVGEMAASGGYFIAMGADRIVASPGAITGSIGVFAGKMVMSELWAKLGIAFETVDVGANAGMLSPNRNFTPEQKAKLNRMLDRIYADFTGKASEGRHLDNGAIDKVARGRIFTGEQALRVGLVDELGGFDAALQAARNAAKLAPDAEVELVYLPKPLSPLERLLSILESGNLPLGLDAMARFGARIDAFARMMGINETAVQARAPHVRIKN